MEGGRDVKTDRRLVGRMVEVLTVAGRGGEGAGRVRGRKGEDVGVEVGRGTSRELQREKGVGRRMEQA